MSCCSSFVKLLYKLLKALKRAPSIPALLLTEVLSLSVLFLSLTSTSLSNIPLKAPLKFSAPCISLLELKITPSISGAAKVPALRLMLLTLAVPATAIWA